MADLHLTKVAVGCETVEILRERLASRAVDGGTFITTRFRPKRADELVGGSLYWIHKHRLVVRQRITGFAEGENAEGRPCCLIHLENRLVPVRARPKRAHQGWRYLEAKNAPADLSDAEEAAEMPAELAGKLAAMALI